MRVGKVGENSGRKAAAALSQAGQRVEIDATLYSANSILGMVPKRNSPHTNGKPFVNGGLVAADVGVLAPSGTDINFDVRGSRALSIQSDSGLAISRRFTAPVVRY